MTTLLATGIDKGASGMETARSPVPGPGGRSFPAGTLFGVIEDQQANQDWIVAYDHASGRLERVVRVRSKLPGRGIAFGPDGASLYVVGADALLRVLDTTSGEARGIGPVADEAGRQYPSGNLHWDPDSASFLSFTGSRIRDQLVRIDPGTGRAHPIGRLPSFDACTLARAPVDLPGPAGETLPAGTWFTFNRMGAEVELLTFDFDDDSLWITRRIGRVGPRSSSQICGSDFVDLAPPSPTPTATATPTSSATATSTATASATPTPTSTERPTATATTAPSGTPTPVPSPIFLPLSLAEECPDTFDRIDVALVIDASSSMREPAAPGSATTKLDAALQAVDSFLDILALDAGDQAAIVSFSSDAWLHAGLTAERAALDAALTEVEPGEQTRLDRGIEVGTAALLDDARRDPDNEPVLIVLTDGRANPVPVDVAVERAADAKAEGITIFTIGLGEDLEVEALRAIASEPAFYLHAPTAGELASVYAEVARSIPCPASAYWGRR